MAACYFSYNNIPGLSAQSIQLDDSSEYLIGGDGITIESGGLSASPESGAEGHAVIAAPLELSGFQIWRLAGRGSPKVEAGLSLAGHVSGSSPLEVVLSEEPVLYFEENNTEVGPVTIRGGDATEPGVLNGAAILLGGKVNSSDGQPVTLTDAYLGGSGVLGALKTTHAELNVGGPEEGMEVSSATLDSASEVTFHIAREGAVAKSAYSQLLSAGAIKLEGAKLEVRVVAGACPVLLPGETYTFVSTTGGLSGSFANAPEGGPEIPIEVASKCPQRFQTMRIAYHESGATQTVTGTVEEAAFIRKQQEAAAKRIQEEEAAARRKQEEEAAAAKATTPGQQLPGNIGQPVPDARVASRTLDVTASGTVKIRISCPALESRCFGTVSLRTLNAVRAGAARTPKKKAAVLNLATGSFSVAGGKATTVVLYLSARARTLLARAHTLKVRATIIAHDPTGAKHTDQTVVTLRAPAAKHRKR
jgi:hypothetical protein